MEVLYLILSVLLLVLYIIILVKYFQMAKNIAKIQDLLYRKFDDTSKNTKDGSEPNNSNEKTIYQMRQEQLEKEQQEK